MTDTISDLLTRIRNSINARLSTVEIPVSKIKVEMVDLLKREGFITDYKINKDDNQGMIKIILRKEKGKNVITGLKRISKPGFRKYTKASEIKQVMNGYGFNILTTSKGILTGDEAKKQNLGGEVLCEVW